MMRKMRCVRTFGYGASLALLLTFSAPGVPRDANGGAAFAQEPGQPGMGQTPTPVASPEPTTGAGQQPAVVVAPVSGGFLPVVGGPEEGSGDRVIEEGGDIGEGLSNQSDDPDD